MQEHILREKYLELNMSAEQIKHLQAQLKAVEEKTIHIESNIQSIRDIKGKKSEEILSPIAEGIFLKAQLKDDETVIVNIGAGICVKKTLEETEQLLRVKQLELAQYTRQMTAQLREVTGAIQNLEAELGSLVQSNENVQIPKK